MKISALRFWENDDILYIDTVYISNFAERYLTMEVSYKKLWKVLIDKDMKKKDLQSAAGISWASVTKLSKGETVSMEVLMKICKTLECNIGDIMDLIPEEIKDNQ